MIYCPQCGTANKPSSKFCKNCAALLAPSTDVRCPICGTMNPSGAATCSNCGTRLTTTSATPSDRTTPADTPENITPFTPPEAPPESDASENPPPSNSARPLFGRASSEWLRRVQKTPPPEAAAGKASAPPTAPGAETQNTTGAQTLKETPAAPTENNIPDWLREIQNEANRQTAAEKNKGEPPAPAKPPLSEIKLTGDDYDYSDIGGQVTDEMKAELEAHADKVQSVDDEIALARKLLGLDAPETPAVTSPMPQAAAQAASTATPVAAAEQANVPSPAEQGQSSEWVTALAAASSAAVVASVESGEGGDVKPEQPEAVAPKEVSAVDASGTAAEEGKTDQGPSVAEPNVRELESGEMPEWLREIVPQDLSSAEPLDLPEQGARPGWLQELKSEALAADTVIPVSEVPDLDEAERGDLPDWLREPVAPIPEPVAESDAVEQPEWLAQKPSIELPSWFSERPGASLGRDPLEVIETTGPLAGISGILPLALAITEPHTLTTLPPTQSDGGRIFQTLLAEPLVSAAPAGTPVKRKGLVTANHLLYLVILLAALIPLYLGLNQAGLGLNASHSGTGLFYDALQSVPVNGTVLLAFEYNPGSAVELDPAARAIVNDLAARRINVIALTSNPNGVTLAQSILQRARETHPQFSFINVGYIPGNEAGLRALASGWLPANRQDVNGVAWGSTPLAQSVPNMDALALTVLIVGEDPSLRTWMEQVKPRITSPIIAATSAMLEPQARNYVNANQLKASLRGLMGAAELELLSNQTGQAVKTMDAFSLVSLVLAGFIIVANILFFVRRKK